MICDSENRFRALWLQRMGGLGLQLFALVGKVKLLGGGLMLLFFFKKRIPEFLVVLKMLAAAQRVAFFSGLLELRDHVLPFRQRRKFRIFFR